MEKKTVTSEEVKKIANLAKLELSDVEVEKFAHQLSDVIDYNIEKLSKVETDSIEPLLNVSGLSSVLREDEAEPGLSQENVLKNAPSSHNGFFKVKAVLENES